MKLALPVATVVVFVTIAGCTSSGTDVEEDLGSEDSALSAPAFLGSSAARNVDIGGYESKQLAVSKEVAAAMTAMTDANDGQNNSFQASGYKIWPAYTEEFNLPNNCHAPRKFMVYDIMFRADGSRPGGQGGNGWAKEFDARYNDLGCREIERGKALARFKRFGAYRSSMASLPAPARRTFEANANKAVGALLKGLGNATTYSCTWTNHDDTSSDALVTVDFKTGDVRTVVALEGG